MDLSHLGLPLRADSKLTQVGLPLREDSQGHVLDAIAIADRKARVPLYNMENEGEYDDRPEAKRNNAGRRAVFYVGSGGRTNVNVAVALNEAGDCIDSVYLPEMLPKAQSSFQTWENLDLT